MLSLTAFADELEREKARQRTYDAMLRKAKAGHETGGRVFGTTTNARTATWNGASTNARPPLCGRFSNGARPGRDSGPSHMN